MDRIERALLSNGNVIEYVVKPNPPRGGMKYTYFTPDKKYVVQFFNDPKDANDPKLRERISAIIGKYNPTMSEKDGGANGNDEKTAAYFAKRFCWPIATVVQPQFGIVCPTYPSNFFFDENASQLLMLKGKDKKSNWFTNKNRQYLNRAELGNFRTLFQLCILLSRSIRRMHQAGLAHSDLSFNNVLIDPKTGGCVVIDIDSLVVPGLYPPEVIGTRGYIAPEVLATLGMNSADRVYPSVYTDLHSMAVLIYEYLFFRHPLIGPKIYSPSAEQDDYLCLGPMATFIENPNDTSNRPNDLKMTIDDLGPYLKPLFLKAFVDGLHEPDLRPTAMEWEQGLVKTWDLLHSCSNPYCEQKWFILHDLKNPVCPSCGTRLNNTEIVSFSFNAERRGSPGQWYEVGRMIAEHNTPLCKWHLYSNIFPDEKAPDRNVHAYVSRSGGKWLLVNNSVDGMISPKGSIVPKGQAILLRDGMVFRASREEKGVLIRVSIKSI